MLQRPIEPASSATRTARPQMTPPAPPDRQTPAAPPAPAPAPADADAAARADALGATLARQTLQRYKRGRGNGSSAPAKKPKLAPMNCRLEPFAAAGFAGSRPNWISAVVKPAEVPTRGKTPIAKACETSASVAGFDGGHIIGLHLGGQNTSVNVVPMFPRFNRGPWKALEDEIKRLAGGTAEELDMTVTISYQHADPRVPSAFVVELESEDEMVLHHVLKQPDDIPGITALPAGYATIIGAAASYQLPALEGTAGRFLLGNATYQDHAAGGHLPPSVRALYPDKPADRPYGNLDVLAINGALVVPGQGTMEANREFSAAQREVILAVNAARHGNQIVSDDPTDPHQILTPQGTVDAPEIDHIVPKVLGGSNLYSNARVVSWYLNNRAARIKPLGDLVDVGRLALPTISGNYEGSEKIAKKEARTIVEQFVARNPQQASVTDTDLKVWILTLWPTLGPELPALLWNRVLARMADAGLTVTSAPAGAVPGRRTVRAKRGQARERMNL